MREGRTYLGDGLYAYHDGIQYWLVSSNGRQDLDSVALEPGVLSEFFQYVERHSKVKITIKRLVEEEGPDVSAR